MEGKHTQRAPAYVIENTAIEVFNKVELGHISHAVLDFDGTISLIRDGWQNVMVPMMVELLLKTPHHEAKNEVTRVVIDFVDKLTGKQTIYQMMRLAEEVEKRGGKPRGPLEYKGMYNDRLMPIVNDRISGLSDGSVDRQSLMTKGSERFLKLLCDRGTQLYLASGTDIEFVEHEAEVLGVAEYFTGGIFGALREHRLFSKEKVIKDILQRFGLSGNRLLIVGDGYVEIANAKEVNAVALGIYSKENNMFEMNVDKRLKLIDAGADILMPDFADAEALVEYLFQG